LLNNESKLIGVVYLFRPAERSAYISEMLPPPSVTHISETLQDSLSATQVIPFLLQSTQLL